MKRYCDNCGRAVDKTFFGLCEECYTGNRYAIRKREDDLRWKKQPPEPIDSGIVKGHLTGGYYWG